MAVYDQPSEKKAAFRHGIMQVAIFNSDAKICTIIFTKCFFALRKKCIAGIKFGFIVFLKDGCDWGYNF